MVTLVVRDMEQRAQRIKARVSVPPMFVQKKGIPTSELAPCAK